MNDIIRLMEISDKTKARMLVLYRQHMRNVLIVEEFGRDTLIGARAAKRHTDAFQEMVELYLNTELPDKSNIYLGVPELVERFGIPVDAKKIEEMKSIGLIFN